MSRDVTSDASNPDKATPVTADKLLIVDTETSPDSLKEITLENLLKFIDSLTQDTIPNIADSVVTYDASAQASKKVTLDDLFNVISGLTEDTSPVGTDDYLVTYDLSAADARKVIPNNLLKVINSLTADTSPDGTVDFLVTYDASALAAKKVLPNNLLKVINSLTEDTAPDTAADYVTTYDASASAAKKVLLSNLLGAATTFTPSFSNTTLGNGTRNGRYIQIGKLVYFDANFTLGSTSAVSGSVALTLPVTAASYAVATQIGNARYRDASAAITYAGLINNGGTLSVSNVSGTYATTDALSGTVPFTWATSDEISVSGIYVAA